jgi:hypothetical protein
MKTSVEERIKTFTKCRNLTRKVAVIVKEKAREMK